MMTNLLILLSSQLAMPVNFYYYTSYFLNMHMARMDEKRKRGPLKLVIYKYICIYEI